MYSTIALGLLFGIFHQVFSSGREIIVVKTEIVKNITVEWNSILNEPTSAVLDTSQTSVKQEFRASNKTTNCTNATSPLYRTSGRNLTNIANKLTIYPFKPALRFLGKCHRTFKFCQRACRDAYRETCKDFECEDDFRKKMKIQCDISCDKELENAPTKK